MKKQGPLGQARVETVLIYVSDFAKMLAFYRDTLGLRVKHQEGEEFAALEAKGGGSEIALHAGRSSTPLARPSWLLEFSVDDIDAVAADLKKRGVAVSAISNQPWGRIASFADPEGNRLGLEEPRSRTS